MVSYKASHGKEELPQVEGRRGRFLLERERRGMRPHLDTQLGVYVAEGGDVRFQKRNSAKVRVWEHSGGAGDGEWVSGSP